MKWKLILIPVGAAAASLAIFMVYFHLDWSLLTQVSFYENIANPSIRIIKVEEGLRKEQIAQIVANKLGWSEAEKDDFINSPLALSYVNYEGHYFPKTYMFSRDDGPVDVSEVMFKEFNREAVNFKKSKSTKIINQETALVIASIIQREAADKNDMKLISGIIWNRLFNGMKLQMDATLQYAKGSEENGWWGKVNPKDKKIVSPFNTYANSGLPPSPISNPGLAAIDAAYNPQSTKCLFYLHDKNKKIHCATTYEEHKKNIEKYY